MDATLGMKPVKPDIKAEKGRMSRDAEGGCSSERSENAVEIRMRHCEHENTKTNCYCSYPYAQP
ncbi:MAG: hypothetical protein D6730_14755 [Bacteroidetes bacterium]|nr:MAG: hypothetical protein D6730_14755 [Bacteroidota bacterium]